MSDCREWLTLMNRWDREIFDRLAETHIGYACPDETHPLCHACMETLRNVVSEDIVCTNILKILLCHFAGIGNVEKMMVVIDSGRLCIEDIVEVLSSIQDEYLLAIYKDMSLPPGVWEGITVSPKCLSRMCRTIEFVEAVRDCGDNELLDVVSVLCPANSKTIDIFKNRTPVAWAANINLTDDILDIALYHKVSPKVIDVLIHRGAKVDQRHVVTLLTYPPSTEREDVYYDMLSVLEISEREFLTKNRCPRTSMMEILDNMDRCQSSDKYANDTNLYGVPISDIPSIFILESHHNDVVYALDVREMINLVDDENEYIHPYTRETVGGEDIVMTHSLIIEKNIPTQDVDSVEKYNPDPLEDMISEVIDDHDLEAYGPNILSLVIAYTPTILYTLQYYPNLVRFYEKSLATTIIKLYPRLTDIAKQSI